MARFLRTALYDRRAVCKAVTHDDGPILRWQWFGFDLPFILCDLVLFLVSAVHIFLITSQVCRRWLCEGAEARTVRDVQHSDEVVLYAHTWTTEPYSCSYVTTLLPCGSLVDSNEVEIYGSIARNQSLKSKLAYSRSVRTYFVSNKRGFFKSEVYYSIHSKTRAYTRKESWLLPQLSCFLGILRIEIFSKTD